MAVNFLSTSTTGATTTGTTSPSTGACNTTSTDLQNEVNQAQSDLGMSGSPSTGGSTYTSSFTPAASTSVDPNAIGAAIPGFTNDPAALTGGSPCTTPTTPQTSSFTPAPSYTPSTGYTPATSFTPGTTYTPYAYPANGTPVYSTNGAVPAPAFTSPFLGNVTPNTTSSGSTTGVYTPPLANGTAYNPNTVLPGSAGHGPGHIHINPLHVAAPIVAFMGARNMYPNPGGKVGWGLSRLQGLDPVQVMDVQNPVGGRLAAIDRTVQKFAFPSRGPMGFVARNFFTRVEVPYPHIPPDAQVLQETRDQISLLASGGGAVVKKSLAQAKYNSKAAASALNDKTGHVTGGRAGRQAGKAYQRQSDARRAKENSVGSARRNGIADAKRLRTEAENLRATAEQSRLAYLAESNAYEQVAKMEDSLLAQVRTAQTPADVNTLVQRTVADLRSRSGVKVNSVLASEIGRDLSGASPAEAVVKLNALATNHRASALLFGNNADAVINGGYVMERNGVIRQYSDPFLKTPPVDQHPPIEQVFNDRISRANAIDTAWRENDGLFRVGFNLLGTNGKMGPVGRLLKGTGKVVGEATPVLGAVNGYFDVQKAMHIVGNPHTSFLKKAMAVLTVGADGLGMLGGPTGFVANLAGMGLQIERDRVH
jgi:hypothetical protein